MPEIFKTIDKIRPAYDFTYKVFMIICKVLLIVDILITSMAVAGRYVPFIPDPAWSEEVVLTCMSYMAVLSAALAIRRNAHIRMTSFDVYLPKKVVKFRSSGRCGGSGSGAHHDHRRLAVCFRPWREGKLCKYAECVQILDVFPRSFGWRCHAGI